MTAFWNMSLCSLVEVYRRFGDAYCPNYQGETTQRYIPEACHLNTRLSDNFKSQKD
jgi:hypothetical protein